MTLFSVSSNLLFDLRSLTDSATQIVQLSASDLTLTGGLNLYYVGRVDGERLLNSATVRNTSYSKGLGDTAAVLGNNRALKQLNSFAGTFLDAAVNTNVVSNLDRRYILLELLICQNLNEIHFGPSLSGTFVLEH